MNYRRTPIICDKLKSNFRFDSWNYFFWIGCFIYYKMMFDFYQISFLVSNE